MKKFFTAGPELSGPAASLCGPLLLCLLAVLSPGAACAQKVRTMPPTVYELASVRIRVTQPSARADIQSRQAVVSGAGASEWKQGDSKASFEYSAEQVVALLNQLYAMRFFEMPELPGAKYSVRLGDDGRVITQALKMADRGGVQVCVEMADYKRCVTSTDNSQPELEQFAQRLFTEAASLAGQ